MSVVSGPVSSVKNAIAVYNALGAVAVKKTKTGLLTMSIMGLYAGFWISLGVMLGVWISANNPNSSPGMIAYAFGALCPLGFILIFFIGADLFTGNVMYMSAGWLLKKTTGWDLLKIWVISWISNFVGCIIMAYAFGYLTDFAAGALVKAWFINNAQYHIQGLGWGQIFLKAILANVLVNCAVWAAGVCDDTGGKIMAIWWPTMAFATLSYEHCVSNMFSLPLGLMLGAGSDANGINIGWMLWKNIIPATLGNIAGGVVGMAIAWWFCLIYMPPGSLEPAKKSTGLGPLPASAGQPLLQQAPPIVLSTSTAPAAATGVEMAAPPRI